MAASRVLIYGGKGALGMTCVTYFKARNWWVASVDLFPNEEAHANVIVSKTESWTEQNEEIQPKVDAILDGIKLDAIVCVAGGWAGGSAKSKAVVKNADLMFKQSVWTSLIAANLASKHLKENGLLTLTGAQPSLGGTPGMLGYGMAKAAVHQLVKGLAEEKGGLPGAASVLAILPMTLDTPGNRKGMPNADFNQWTPLDYVAKLLFEWAQRSNVPERGSLVKLNTKDGVSSYEIHTGELLS
ncbi:PREDICTED: dihydropteridine reductase-like [Acropora digitifera]|uniref:dihydropteridine reductase-like n=1 Tax=Acropora digitifera TaxID=70779 RepID=UPI00077A8768|nr:PREDICTED: dihydropteridine reductase-like [Acropora digitifera]XP_029209551.1 dihydropteridine reductase-like [Acropora millepora]